MIEERKIILLRYIDMLINIYLKTKASSDSRLQAQGILTEANKSMEQQIEFIKNEALQDFIEDYGD